MTDFARDIAATVASPLQIQRDPSPLDYELSDSAGSVAYFERVHGDTKGALSSAARRVYVRFSINDIRDIDAIAGSISIDFTLMARWHDPWVAGALQAAAPSAKSRSPGSPGGLLLRSPSSTGMGGGSAVLGAFDEAGNCSLWHPQLGVCNALDMHGLLEPHLQWRVIEEQPGQVEWRQRYKGTISNRMDLRAFPFDADLLVLQIHSNVYSSRQVELLPDPLVDDGSDTNDSRAAAAASSSNSTSDGVNAGASAGGSGSSAALRLTPVRHSLDEWHIDPRPSVVSSTLLAKSRGGAPVRDPSADPIWGSHRDASSAVYLVLRAARKPQYYIWKIGLVQALVAVWSWSAFFHPNEDIAGRMSTTLTLFLSSVAFLHASSAGLPRVPYLTLLDVFTILSFFLLFLTAAENLLVFWCAYHLHQDEAAEAIDRTCRFLFPLAHTTAVAALALQVRRHRRSHLDLAEELA